MDDSLGLYISVPFCRTKCSFCNFASDVFAPARMDGYVDRLCQELSEASAHAGRIGARLPQGIDSIYFGGGTPSLLEAEHLQRLFAAIHRHFHVDEDTEITLEAAPGQLEAKTVTAAVQMGVNRISFGVQSFVDAESAAVGRLHRGAGCLAEFDRVRAAGIDRVSLDLIVGLPHQTEESWLFSVAQAIASGVDHVSLYMLEIDEDSRLGREALAGGSRYHAAALPSEDQAADWYLVACERLRNAGLAQYEISNFARPGCESRHNLKYWVRSPYLGCGLDAHSMLRTDAPAALRWANPDDLDRYMAPGGSAKAPLSLYRPKDGPSIDLIGPDEAFEEEFFLGLRLTEGINLDRLGTIYGRSRTASVHAALEDVQLAGLLDRCDSQIRLTARGRLASNEVFSRLLLQ